MNCPDSDDVNVLIVDDNAVFAMELEEKVRDLGYKIAGISDNGFQAVQMAKSHRPELILMDIKMPGELDGIEAAQAILEEYDVPILFITGHVKESILEKANQVSNCGYIVKPVHRGQIKAAMNLAIREKGPQRRKPPDDEMASDRRETAAHRIERMKSLLSPTEYRIAKLISKGKNSEEIAQILNSSPRTVEWHRMNIRKKLGISDRKISTFNFLEVFSVFMGLFLLSLLVACGDGDTAVNSGGGGLGGEEDVVVNVCSDYTGYWMDECPSGERCLTFKNSCTKDIYLMYNVGCNSDGKAGSPQCDCTMGPKLEKNGGVKYWKIVDGDYAPGSSTYSPACLTESLQVMANYEQNQCTLGTRIEFTAGNSGDPYGKFDSPNISTQGSADPPPEGVYYSVPVSFKPDIPCSQDTFNDCGCRPLYCNSLDCPDAYLTPTTNGCSNCNAPGVGCQTTFGNFGAPAGFTIEYCPSDCETTGGACPSCQTADLCS